MILDSERAVNGVRSDLRYMTTIHELFPAVQYDRDRPIVVDLDEDVLLEASGLAFQAACPSGGDKLLKQGFGLIRRSGVREAGAPSFSGIGEQSELADCQDVALDVEGGQVELAGAVLKDAHLDCLLRQVLRVSFR